ncbi:MULTISPECIES: cytochrome c oxidase subunit II [Flavobacterium]|jgi:cytochrome c oxidase subunit 2|uniref:cytochrome-c oxidase n=1 Tax=Flavobacterium cupriresistens TaxID=2893885 RepID=A0ABU4R8Z1_9FLAO|nr:MULTISPECIES: cytochrome c oxidase subunit II [unclassified Flavobacterium]KLT71700.1 cytochrome C oxidase subunit II [Flavobacterium sp. ABG]MDX6189050.1 cytochrome c oxidase subunit II [Flavobacterium sp. Fl-318]UFH44170.1 cytochrome c oxidase subunit II [Flavobacterium sp. F-323]
MTSLLVIIVLVLLAVALWQLTRIFDLTQVGASSDDSQVASDNDNNIQGYIMFGFLAFIYIFTIYGLLKWGNLALHTPASEHGILVDSLMNITWVLIFIVQAITQGLLYWFSFKNRGHKDRKALFFADSNKLEAMWSIIPSVVLACLILYGLYAWNNIMFVDKDEDVIEIELYAQQFKWTARYAGNDNTLGKANVRLIEGINTLGVDMSDKNSEDDIIVSELHIPKGKKVHFKMRSQDVLHSAYMPHFRAQMNCVPGMVTEFAFVPTYTTAEYRELPFMVEKVAHINKLRAEKSLELVAKGGTALDPYTFDYLLLCNKICGASHYNMQMKVVVDTPEDYKKWLSEKTTLSQDIKAAAAAEKPAEGAKANTTDSTAKDTVKAVIDTVKAVIAKVATK